MKGKFDVYLLWLLGGKLIYAIVARSTVCDCTVTPILQVFTLQLQIATYFKGKLDSGLNILTGKILWYLHKYIPKLNNFNPKNHRHRVKCCSVKEVKNLKGSNTLASLSEFVKPMGPSRAWVRNLKQQVPITSKSSNFRGETQRYVVKLPKSAGAG